MEYELKATIPLWFYKPTVTYTAGEGKSATYALILSNPLYCQWTGGYGDRAIMAASMGVTAFATVRMYYHPTIFTALSADRIFLARDTTTGAIIDGIPQLDCINLYEVWGQPENYKNENRYMEYRVKRIERL